MHTHAAFNKTAVHVRSLAYAAILATLIIYWPGLSGPFLLDDLPNLGPLQQWLDGRASAQELIFGNTSGRLGRPVSMATLWFSAATGGMHPFPFKLGNLIIHVLCGLAGWQLLKRLLKQDPQLARQASLIAAVLAGLWMLMPLHVSTVLYSVQRMAQLSALFVLLALWIYVLARQQLASGQSRRAGVKLFFFFPLLVLAGLFSKENAAVAVLLCAVVELAYFLDRPRQGKVLPTFYTIFLILPAILVIAGLLVAPDRIIGSYGGRDFTLAERLLSQPRALWEYIGLMLWPRGGMMGVFVDDFQTSTGLLSPPATLPALLGLFATSGFAIAIRRQAPSVFAGWFFFLAAHSIESTVFPLELYFEHRNYLPSFGVLLAVAGLLSWLAGKVPMNRQRYARTTSYALMTAMAVAYLWTTWSQVQIWRSQETIADQALANRPTSLRATLAKVTLLVGRQHYDEAMQLTGQLINSPNPRHQLLGNLHTLTIDCIRGQGADLRYLRQAEQADVAFVTIAEAQALTQLSRALSTGNCGAIVTDGLVADRLSRFLDDLDQSDGARGKWLMRGSLASMYIHAGRWDDAQTQAELAWRPTASDTAIGGMLVGIYLHNGNPEAAQRTLDELRLRVHDYELTAMHRIGMLQAQIDAATTQ